MQPPLLIVFSHLRWGFVYQRPQHLLSRLAGRWRVLFVEEPVHDAGSPWLEEQLLDKNLTVLVPHSPLSAAGFHDDQIPVLQSMLGDYLRRQAQPVSVAWLYTPMALPLLATVRPLSVVYDCMDELAAFKGAARQLRQRESALMKQAAVVLTGGLSLYEARQEQHPHVVCLPSSVDAAHYASDRLQPDAPEQKKAEQLQGHVAGPRLGYFGVIDERLDTELVAQVADARPDWSVVMVGPVVKIDAAALPQRPNIHWLGMQPYPMLPYLLAGWDLCLMPFAMNDSTRFISPTKTLEYMAGGKPVVSTPVHDVVWMYSDAVAVAPRGPDFIEACASVLGEDAGQRGRREMQMMSLVSASSWDRSAQAVHELLLRALSDARRASEVRSPPAAIAPRRAAAGAG